MSDGQADINSYFVRELLSCPLKLPFLLQRGSVSYGDASFRSLVKLQLARVLDLSFPDALRAARDVETATRQFVEWITGRDVTICGGVARHGVFRSRIPLIRRQGDQITLYQVHGRLWRSARRTLGPELPDNGGLLGYIREAAYRSHLLEHHLPGCRISVRLCFPSPDFRAGVPGLFEAVASGTVQDGELDGLLCEVDATQAVRSLLSEKLDSGFLHPDYSGLTFSQSLERIRKLLAGELSSRFQVCGACRSCPFRQSDAAGALTGCWEQHGVSGDEEESHIYELIGQGNGSATKNGYLLQREVPLPACHSTFQKVAESGGRAISIEQRRALRLLDARGEKIPLEWIRRGLAAEIDKVRFPLHFIDFEAAAPPVPLFEGDGVYEDVLFQFSCHTLRSDGSVAHTHWLDRSGHGATRREFAAALIDVPEIEEGTLIHYSPYEQQALQRLLRHIGAESGAERLTDGLNRLIRPAEKGGDRFMDLSRLTGSYYFNAGMDGGLGLKEVLPAVLRVSDSLRHYCRNPLPFAGESVRLSDSRTGNVRNPYDLIPPGGPVFDGQSAMDGWLVARSGLVTPGMADRIHRDLERYCSADSLGMLLIYIHWKGRADEMSDSQEDFLHDEGS